MDELVKGEDICAAPGCDHELQDGEDIYIAGSRKYGPEKSLNYCQKHKRLFAGSAQDRMNLYLEHYRQIHGFWPHQT